MTKWTIGIDLGGTKIEFGLINPKKEIVTRHKIPTEPETGPQALIEKIENGVMNLAKRLPNNEKIAALGICCPGPVNVRAGKLVDPPNLTGLHHMPIVDMLKERLTMPIILEHDAKAAAFGEFHFGSGKDKKNLAFLVSGTGVGGAMVLDGKLFYGDHDFAGEIGHMVFDLHGDLCTCGAHGCLQTFTSGPSLVKRYQKKQDEQGVPRDDKPLAGEDIAKKAHQGDLIAAEVFKEAGEILGLAIISITMTLNIDCFVIGGSVIKAGELLLTPMRNIVKNHSFKTVTECVEIHPSTMGTDAPILGCGELALQALDH